MSLSRSSKLQLAPCEKALFLPILEGEGDFERKARMDDGNKSS